MADKKRWARVGVALAAVMAVFVVTTQLANAAGYTSSVDYSNVAANQGNGAQATSSATAGSSSGSCMMYNAFDKDPKNGNYKIWYYVNGAQVQSLSSAKPQQGSVITVSFVIRPGCKNVPVSLISYQGPDPSFVAAHASQQQLFDAKGGSYSGDGAVHTLRSVKLPSCYYQVDLATETPVTPLATTSYKNSLVDAWYGGDNYCSSQNQPSKVNPPAASQPVNDQSVSTCPTSVPARVSRNVTWSSDSQATSNSGYGTGKTDSSMSNASIDTGSLSAGSSVSARFQVASGCSERVTLLAYQVGSPDTSSTATRLSSWSSDVFSEGSHSLKVKVPDCRYRLDLVQGGTPDSLGISSTSISGTSDSGAANSNWTNTTDQSAFVVASVNGGTQCQAPAQVQSTQTQPVATPSAPAPQVLGEVVSAPSPAPAQQTPVRSQLAVTGVDFLPEVGLGILLTGIGIALLRPARRMRYTD